MFNFLKWLFLPSFRRGKARRRLERICRQAGCNRALSKRISYLTFSKSAKHGTIAVPSRKLDARDMPVP